MNCAKPLPLFHISGVFALAICLMIMETPEVKIKYTHSEEPYNVYIAKHDNIYEPIGTVFEVCKIL